ncbi:hypothetical protein FE848_12950 [Marinobacter sp. 1-3A]|uniref:hypothetical protein n=1 Tax=Marinobacter sp. 1-3A TaxID=2582920 RepID=UPI0019049415|nr:hypothetical protein [Marinobacter sp. 1-3A]MBK1874135.1 hypothetical protein [Marinobacter sp. 1-3A]
MSRPRKSAWPGPTEKWGFDPGKRRLMGLEYGTIPQPRENPPESGLHHQTPSHPSLRA